LSPEKKRSDHRAGQSNFLPLAEAEKRKGEGKKIIAINRIQKREKKKKKRDAAEMRRLEWYGTLRKKRMRGEKRDRPILK